MKILVSNLGSTSLKWRLFDFSNGAERVLHKGGFERVTNYAQAVEDCLAQLVSAGVIADEADLDAVGFKTIIAKDINGCVEIDEHVLQAMEAYSALAPAHNPPYVSGIRQFQQRIPGVPLVALFETAFYQFAPEAMMRYAVPDAWHDAGVRRWGFHGASHKFIAERSAELLGRLDVVERARELYSQASTSPQVSSILIARGAPPPRAAAAALEDSLSSRRLRAALPESEPESLARAGQTPQRQTAPAAASPSESASRGDAARGGGAPRATNIDDNLPNLRVISCHLGGSSSVTGILGGVAIGTSMGMSPQSGLPQNNRVGDLDSGALPYVMDALGLSREEAERQLTKESGLKGLSGLSNDIRDIEAAAANGDEKSQLALDVFVASARHWIGAYFFEMGGADAIVFTAGIGENSANVRTRICANLDRLGIVLDDQANAATIGREGVISAANSTVKILVIPTNEELVVAREARRLLTAADPARDLARETHVSVTL